MKLAALLLALSAARPFTPPDEGAVEARLKSAKSAPSLAERLRAVSDPFLGAPYALSPLGEGDGHAPDADPRMRFDAFDCTTFVETTMALALAEDLDETRALLDVIRYREGKVGYLERRHFPEAEWIPELARLGFLKDITREVAGADAVVATKRLDRFLWQRSQNHKGTPTLPDERIPDGTFALDIWPLEAALKAPERIPPGTLVNVVRVDFKSAPVRVSHQGLIVEKNGKRYFRHAADRMFHSVVDEPLDHFLLRMSKYKKWPVAGFNLTLVVEPPGWRALLPTRSSGAAAQVTTADDLDGPGAPTGQGAR